MKSAYVWPRYIPCIIRVATQVEGTAYKDKKHNKTSQVKSNPNEKKKRLMEENKRIPKRSCKSRDANLRSGMEREGGEPNVRNRKKKREIKERESKRNKEEKRTEKRWREREREK